MAWEKGCCGELHNVWGISLPREPLEEWVAPICIYWAASLKDCSSRRVGWPVGAVEKGQEVGQAE